MSETEQNHAATGWFSQLPVQFRVSLTLGGIAGLMAVAAGLRILVRDSNDPVAWRLPLGIFLLFSTWFLTSYVSDRIMQGKSQSPRSEQVILKSPLDLFCRNADEPLSLRLSIATNGVLLISGSILVLILSFMALFGSDLQK